MRIIELFITEQFSDDTIVVRVNGKIEFRGEHITSKLLLGVAEEVTIEAPNAKLKLEVEAPNKSLRAEMEIAPGEDVRVEVRQEMGQLALRLLKGEQGFL